ncbi:MAG: hypothetical protein ACXVRJ_15090, partial [Gaiellaceae bacterium]
HARLRARLTVLARLVVVGMATLAVFVQLAVWGATKIRSNGALLESWQPYFGWPYDLALAGAQLTVCRALRIRGGVVWIAAAWASGIAFALLGWGLGHRPAFDASVALASGLGALVLAAALYDGRLAPARRRRPGT